MAGDLPVTLHVIDDDEAVRRGIALLLGAEGIAHALYPSAQSFLDALPALREGAAGCILTDVVMPGMDGLTLLRTLRSDGLTWPIIVMTAYGDIGTAVRAMKTGASDFIEKPFEDEVLLEAIASATAEQRSAPAGSAVRAPSAANQDAARRIGELSGREREVLDLLVAGKPNKLIAFELGISQRTAEVHRARMMARLGVRSLAEAVRLAVRADLPPPNPV